MESNIDSTELPVGLGPLAAAIEALAAEDLTRLPAPQAAQRVLVLRGLLERLPDPRVATYETLRHAPALPAWRDRVLDLLRGRD